MIVREALVAAREALSEMEGSRLESEWLVSFAVGTTPSKLVLFEDREIDAKWLADALRRRLEGEPLAYITGEKGFFKHVFLVRPGVLIPRPETEHVVEAALRLIDSAQPVNICDLGCGSGCIGLSLVAEWPDARLVALDQAREAIETAKANAERLGVIDRCAFINSNVKSYAVESQFDLVVANPPYIDPSDTRTEPTVRRFEPHQALFADRGGLGEIFFWTDWAMSALRPGGWWIVEIGTGQNSEVGAKLESLGFENVQFERDLAGHVRVVFGKRPLVAEDENG